MKNYPTLYAAPLLKPEGVQALLRDPQLHWKKGRSAYEAAHKWVHANLELTGGLPHNVRNVLDITTEWTGSVVATGFFEHATALDTERGPTNTDLLLLCRLSDALGVIAVEAKAGEPFGELINFWNTTPGRADRLKWACEMLGVDETICGTLRWQLFHRTAAAILEAKRFRAPHAIMLVHDFSQKPSWVEDYLAFAQAIGFSDAGVDTITSAREIAGISLRLAWVNDPALEGVAV